jgi:hemerythrin-like metal-binding protein
MPLLSWKPGYSVNEVVLDSHHQELFCILNTVYENVMNSLEVDCVLPIIDKLSEYTRYHFSTEEQFMREKEFRELDDHIAKHREFTHTIEKLRTRYHDNDLEVTRELIIVLGDWLLRHVLKDDMRYSELSARHQD